jgi:hypothetical protein
MYVPAASSPECIEAKRLLELTARACRKATTAPSLTASEDSSPHSPTQDVSTPEAVSGPGARHADSSLASYDHWSMIEPPARAAQRVPCMKLSGSFSDALALLLRSRSPKAGAPQSPAEATHRSGLSVSNLAPSLTPSAEPSQEQAGDDRWPQESGSAMHSRILAAQLDGMQKLPELEDPSCSVNAGVAWQFGDRIIPADLLRECVPLPVLSEWGFFPLRSCGDALPV